MHDNGGEDHTVLLSVNRSHDCTAASPTRTGKRINKPVLLVVYITL